MKQFVLGSPSWQMEARNWTQPFRAQRAVFLLPSGSCLYCWFLQLSSHLQVETLQQRSVCNCPEHSSRLLDFCSTPDAWLYEKHVFKTMG